MPRKKQEKTCFLRGILREILDTCGNIKKMTRLAGITEVGVAMPAKKGSVTDAERAKRIREAARDHETNNDPASFERAFASVSRGIQKKKSEENKK
jgi:hypothetical protein